ncbi:hypothetical protein [Burkholderia pyrrocinia]
MENHNKTPLIKHVYRVEIIVLCLILSGVAARFVWRWIQTIPTPTSALLLKSTGQLAVLFVLIGVSYAVGHSFGRRQGRVEGLAEGRALGHVSPDRIADMISNYQPAATAQLPVESQSLQFPDEHTSEQSAAREAGCEWTEEQLLSLLAEYERGGVTHDVLGERYGISGRRVGQLLSKARDIRTPSSTTSPIWPGIRRE